MKTLILTFCTLVLCVLINAQPLRNLADSNCIIMGTYVEGFDNYVDSLPPNGPLNINIPLLMTSNSYANIVATEFNAVVVNVGMTTIQSGGPGTFDFEWQDSLIARAEASNQTIFGQHLFWWESTPDWFYDPSIDCDSATVIMKTYIDSVVGRYAGRIDYYSVLNEELKFENFTNPTAWRDSTRWRLCLGPYFADSLFIWVRNIDPNAKLYYNETHAESTDLGFVGDRSDSVFAFVSRLVNDSVPIDGVGLQMHTSLSANNPFPLPRTKSLLATNIQRIGTLGLESYITEMDVTISGGTGNVKEEQGRVYGEALEVCLSDPNCKAFNIWGVYDDVSWVRYGTGDPYDQPLIFDSLYQAKFAYDSLKSVLNNQNWCSVTSIENNIQGDFTLSTKIYPNPIYNNLNLEFNLTKSTLVSAKLYNTLGYLIRIFIGNEQLFKGYHNFNYSVSQVPSGLYNLVITTNNGQLNSKLLIAR